MKNFAITLLTLMVSVITMYGQTSRPTSMILRYHNVIEFVFDEQTQKYIANDTIEFSGAISIDPINVFIKGYNNKPDKTLKIIEFKKEKRTDRDMYTCKMNGEKYAIAVSPDRKYLTQIGLNDKFIYELKTSDNKEDNQIQFITINKDSQTEEIFIAPSLEVKPIFGDANSFEEGENKLKEYLSTEINKHEKLSGSCYISIVIDKEGKVGDVKLRFGTNDEFNKAAIEVVKNMPDWKPGKHKGNPVNASYNLEVKK